MTCFMFAQGLKQAAGCMYCCYIWYIFDCNKYLQIFVFNIDEISLERLTRGLGVVPRGERVLEELVARAARACPRATAEVKCRVDCNTSRDNSKLL